MTLPEEVVPPTLNSASTGDDCKNSGESIEERCFSAALICLEGHFTRSPPMGPLTAARVSSMVSKTLEKTHTLRTCREALSRNVAIWIWLTRIFAAAIPSLTTRAVGPLSSLNDPDKGVTPQESTALIVMNHASMKEDLGTLIKLMHIARNLLVNAEPEVPQDICAAVHFDQMVYQTIILCVNVTSKGYDGEILDETQRLKLADVTELYKKLLVTSLQQAHNWTAKHDRNKMSFWYDVLFDEDEGAFGGQEDGVGDGSGFKPDVAKCQVQHWLERNSRMCDTARKLLKDYADNHSDKPPGKLAPIGPLAWNWLYEDSVGDPYDAGDSHEKMNPVWKPDEPDKFEQDKAYGRVSREIDTWWLRARDPNFEEWTVHTPSVEFAQSRAEHCKTNLVHRYSHSYHGDHSPPPEAVDDDLSEQDHCHHCPECYGCHHHHEEEGEYEDDKEHDHGHACGHHHDLEEHHHEHYQEHGQENGHEHEYEQGTEQYHAQDQGQDQGQDQEQDQEQCHAQDYVQDHQQDHQQDFEEDYEQDRDHEQDHDADLEHDTECEHHHDEDHAHHHDHVHDYGHEYDDMDDEDDDDDYGEGPLTGLLTEVPNILDPKQIEALHMIVKSCILDNAGSGLTRAGENLQKTRCRMFLALDCGKSLLRELLVFIAVWDKDEQTLIFQVTTQIAEALHHSALIPYAWNSLRIPKDIISPAQTVLLRLVSHMFRARLNNASHVAANNATQGSHNSPDPNTNSSSAASGGSSSSNGATGAGPHEKDQSRDIKLVQFLFSYFRSRVVPECAALMHLQAQIRDGKCDPSEFPVDSWDMERAKDGLAQYLDFLITVAEMVDTRTKLIEWEAVYDLITILGGVEAGVAKKPLVELPKRSPKAESNPPSTNSGTAGTPTRPMVERPYAAEPSSPPPSLPPPMQECAHKFPWPGIKAQIFTILAMLLQPPVGKSSPGNPIVQSQMVKFNGIVPLLNSCAYDDHNPFAKERVTICLKWLLDGCEAANNFFRELVSMSPQRGLRPPPGGVVVSTLRVDGIAGDIRVQVRSGTGRGRVVGEAEDEEDDFLKKAADMRLGDGIVVTGRSLEDDFLA
ncbi:hypothetical protein E4U57_002755 [Claviceps arundinis]|uniref:Ataxin-10 homolog n=1 Tax=Claviceps arundinis TaxID=1623583 RepID=A0ABQ7PA81_9HYPO|nr:hypothetical protein E4U57_002755 [Claviceps arundinis]